MSTLVSPPDVAANPLATIQLFARLDDEERRALFETMSKQHADANQTIFWLGETGDSFFVVAQGKVGVTVPNEKGEHIMLNQLEAGGFFGEISLLDGGPRTASVRALETTELLVLSREAFHSFLRQRPDVAIEILTVMGQRQRISTEALRSMKNANVVFDQAQVTWWQRISDIIASIAASQWFTIFHLIWFGLWIGTNSLGHLWDEPPALFSWDPFPFGLLTMVVSLEAIFLSIFVMVSQNRQSEKDRVRTDLDYQVNVKAQTEIISIARRLEQLEAGVAKVVAGKAD